MRIVVTLPGIALAASACAGSGSPLGPIGEGYVRLTLQLAKHDHGLVEAWRGPEAWRPELRVPVAELSKEIERMHAAAELALLELTSAEERARGRYLEHQLRALQFAAERLMGRSSSIDDQARQEFAATFSRVDRNALANDHTRLEALLPGAGTLADRLAALRIATAVPAERRGRVIEAAMAACRAATARAVDLPQGEHVLVAFRKGLAWDAYARYAGAQRTEIDINDDGPLDVSRAFRLACHEAYPGHHVQHVFIDRLQAEHGWPELQLTPGFGRHLLLAEGAAEVAADLALNAADREILYRDTLLPLAGLAPERADTLVGVEDILIELLPVVTDVARRYLDGSIDQASAIEQLTDVALVANPAATLAFIEQRRGRALVYGEGRRAVYAMLPTRDLPGLRAAFGAGAVQ
jgi:hypothetical protein